MNDHAGASEASFPRIPLLGAATLVSFALIMVTATQLHKAHSHAPLDSGRATVAERDLLFEDKSDGGIAVIDARSKLPIDTVAPGTNGFLRGTLRGLARERKREGFGQTTPFQLSETRAGHLLLTDPTTKRYIDLGSFGPTNAEAFAKLLTDTVVTNSPAPSPHA